MAFADLSAILSGMLPGLSPALADIHINWAWRDIRNARTWGFLQDDAAIVCPVQITTGAIALVQYALTVTCNAAASAALVAAPATPGLTALQIRFNTSSTGQAGALYNILSVDSSVPAAVVLTLDRMVMEATTAAATYQCYRAYVTPPDTDFLGWQSVVDVANGLRPLKLNRTSTWFDLRDPQRQARGLAYYVGAYKGATTTNPLVDYGTPLYELWPHPVQGQVLYVRYRHQGTDFFDVADTQPAIISDQLIVQRALGWYSYPFAAANAGRFAGMKSVNFMQLATDSKKIWQEEMTRAAKNDEEQMLQAIISRGHGLRRGPDDRPYPIDAAYLQSHLVNI